MTSLIGYFKDVIHEMRHVVWPTPLQTTLFSVLVIGISVVAAVILGAADAGFSNLIKFAV